MKDKICKHAVWTSQCPYCREVKLNVSASGSNELLCCEPEPIDLTCPECGEVFLGWKEHEGTLCLDCYTSKHSAT